MVAFILPLKFDRVTCNFRALLELITFPVSHDRAFIDAVGTDLIFWDHHGFNLTYYHGTLSEHAERASEQALGFERLVTTLEKDKAKLAESIEVLHI